MGREQRSYRERELELKEELLSFKKKGIFGKLKDAWVNKVPSSMKMALGGAAVGLSVTSGGVIPVLGAIVASLVARKTVTSFGNRFFGQSAVGKRIKKA